MERSLWIIRHGKSSWDHEGLSDHERPLAPRGIRNAGEMAEDIFQSGLFPEHILSSSAVRALSTARIMKAIWGIDEKHLEIIEGLYFCSSRDVAEIIAETPAEYTRLAIFGHNPTFTDFANHFLEKGLYNLPTAGIVRLDFDADAWSGLSRNTLIREEVLTPKKRRDG